MIRMKHDKKLNYLIVYSDERKYINFPDGSIGGAEHILLGKHPVPDISRYQESEISITAFADTRQKRESIKKDYDEYDSLPDYKETT